MARHVDMYPFVVGTFYMTHRDVTIPGIRAYSGFMSTLNNHTCAQIHSKFSYDSAPRPMANSSIKSMTLGDRCKVVAQMFFRGSGSFFVSVCVDTNFRLIDETWPSVSQYHGRCRRGLISLHSSSPKSACILDCSQADQGGS
jgi:hypothetical protein